MGRRKSTSPDELIALQRQENADPLQAAFDVSDGQVANLFRDLAVLIRYTDFEHVAIQTFKLVRNLVLLDKFSALTSEEIAGRLEEDPELVESLRVTPEYQEMVHAVEAAWGRIKKPRSIDEHLQDPEMQDRIWRETMRKGLLDPDSTTAERALGQYNDRAKPRVTKEVERRVLMVSTDTLRVIQETQRQLGLPAGDVIEGEEVG